MATGERLGCGQGRKQGKGLLGCSPSPQIEIEIGFGTRLYQTFNVIYL